MAANFINTTEQVRELVTKIEQWTPKDPFLFIDLEGINLSRQGSISIMQLLIGPEKTVYLLDIHNLQQDAFHTPSPQGLTLHDILESEHYPKVFFDIRMDSDALYAHFQVKLRCVIDLQLLEFITRSMRGQFLSGLGKCIEKDAGLSYKEVREWTAVKEAGRRHFAPEAGGKYEVFNERPLKAALTNYCVQDVQCMPRLLMRYAGRLSDAEAMKVQNETAARVRKSQDATPLRKGRHMAIGPAFAPLYYSSTSVKLKYPMNIICSPALKLYCDSVASGHAQVYSTVSITTSTTIESIATADRNKADTIIHTESKLPKVVIEDVTAAVTPTQTPTNQSLPYPESPIIKHERTNKPSKMAPTVSKALEQLSSVKTPDFTLSPQTTVFATDDDDDDDESYQDSEKDGDIGNVDKYLSSLRLSSARFNATVTADDYHFRSDDSRWEYGDDNPRDSDKDYTACSADDCGYCGHCGY